ncbi:amidase [Aliiruegeria sabulilitoris]|uniref:amidase n=1 Tax=Aliiruegeria sabulilitoris TaxID=1510458 RepID=UPI00082A1223|nr:amidase [Aliiruegeria sabulilitoris]NDR57161.1 amidase [Pseudoruegeria sp. M32A2M]
MNGRDLTQLPAAQAAAEIRSGVLTSEALVQACLARIAETDGTIQAWEYLDPEAALSQAREMDEIRRAGRATGPLHGVPVGLKDIVDTAHAPTAFGSPIFDGNRPAADACIVERLREAGAVILGKTRTTEFAFAHPTTTTNPWDSSRSPGGSSSGSAAAVAAGQVPLAVGTQTAGSVIRPASFCGVFGFKPTRGTISRRGVLQTSQTLDQVGVFGRTLEDVALLAEVLGSYDPSDPLSLPRPRPAMVAGVEAEPPVAPDIAWFDLAFHDRLDPDAREGYEQVIEALGPRVQRFDVAPQLSDLGQVQQTIHEYEFLQNFRELIERDQDRLSPTLRAVIERARAISQAQYEDALAVKASAETFFAEHFKDFDAILAPSATGEAPLLSAGTTGDPAFSRIWTLAGLPCVSLPILVGAQGLPIGTQLVGACELDDRLLRTASWLLKSLSENEEDI